MSFNSKANHGIRPLQVVKAMRGSIVTEHKTFKQMTQKGYKFRFYPNQQQRKQLAIDFGHCRWVWNLALEMRSRAWKEQQLGLSGIDISRQITKIKRMPEFEWLKAASSTCLAQKLRDQDTAFKNFFAGRARYPKFKKKLDEQQVRYQLDQRRVDKNYKAGEFIKLPRLGKMKIRWSQMPGSAPKMVTIRKDAADRYFITFMCEETIQALPQRTNGVGVDLGVKDIAATSDGDKEYNPKHFVKYQWQLKKAQRVMARRNKGSGRWHRARRKVARLHGKVRDARKDQQHKLTWKLVRQHQLVAIEDLYVKGMMSSAKGTIENPGRMVKQKSGLNRAIADVGMYEIRRQLEYKSAWYARDLVVVDRFAATSKTCSCCGEVKQDLTLKERDWVCANCGTAHDRDINAARNIYILATVGSTETNSKTQARGAGHLSAAVLLFNTDQRPALKRESDSQKAISNTALNGRSLSDAVG